MGYEDEAAGDWFVGQGDSYGLDYTPEASETYSGGLLSSGGSGEDSWGALGNFGDEGEWQGYTKFPTVSDNYSSNDSSISSNSGQGSNYPGGGYPSSWDSRPLRDDRTYKIGSPLPASSGSSSGGSSRAPVSSGRGGVLPVQQRRPSSYPVQQTQQAKSPVDISGIISSLSSSFKEIPVPAVGSAPTLGIAGYSKTEENEARQRALMGPYMQLMQTIREAVQASVGHNANPVLAKYGLEGAFKQYGNALSDVATKASVVGMQHAEKQQQTSQAAKNLQFQTDTSIYNAAQARAFQAQSANAENWNKMKQAIFAASVAAARG